VSAAGWASLAFYAVPLLLVWGAYVGLRARRDRRNRTMLRESRAAGLAEPPSLHPRIDPARCLGCATCVAACPEGDVLGVIGGKAELVQPASCIGHGACRAACPTGAITLVLGTERRGVDIPVLGPDFQTSVPGVFVAGELGGMGLIRNAIEQGRQAVDAIRARAGARGGGAGDALDLVIVGAGPAGLSASLAARQHGLRAVTLEQEALGGAVAHFPRGKIVMTSPAELPLVGRLPFRETSKENLLAFWRDVEQRSGVRIRYGERVESLRRTGETLEVRSSGGVLRARSVLLAVGRRGTPRKLGVPGEELPKVVYRLDDPGQYTGRHVLVVGGGDSALEAAASVVEESDAKVVLSYRGDAFVRAKPKNRARIESATASRRLHVALASTIREIRSDRVRLATARGEGLVRNDDVIVCAGGVLPTAFLEAAGVSMQTVHGEPLERGGR
jgi:thioredoxin reductase/ferredoxin